MKKDFQLTVLGARGSMAACREECGVFGGDTPAGVVAGFREFLNSLGVPKSLAAYPDITPELLEKTAASGKENAMKLELAPRRVPLERSREILAAILNEALRG